MKKKASRKSAGKKAPAAKKSESKSSKPSAAKAKKTSGSAKKASAAKAPKSKPLSAKAAASGKPAPKKKTRSTAAPAKKSAAAASKRNPPKAAAKPETRSVKKTASESAALDEAQVKVSRVQKNGGWKVLRPKSFAQTSAQWEAGFPAETPELPESYGIDRVTLMVKDPDILFSYWELTPGLLAQKSGEKHTGEEYREAIKLNWPARSLFDMNFALLPVSFGSRRWYLRAPIPGLVYNVELGWLSEAGHFISLLRSEEAALPETWEAARLRLEKLGEPIEYMMRISQPLGASEHVQVEEARFSPTDWTVSSESFSSSSAAKSAGQSQPAPSSSRRPDSLRVEARLRPGSRLRVDGRELVADSEGRVRATVAPHRDDFTLELLLPGGGTQAFTYDL
jgi:hypothetical protein